ncbi:E3 ubiquitin-protein ligase DTX1-like [Sinocyclocheilus grahami]|uniref:E3 ubiquitin-protein ligase DTX1-like n=1 Tax=Sinocyclocheilus grahami TaxID=75366 RepID=UPI0007ACFA7E|nr:PREDICTED: E3 ubiquitin-protein ligase DTX1-like [Sinocyclocheilus grahami]
MARPGSGVLGGGYSSQSMARVVVWEWLNEHGRWRPYTAAVCHHIENVLKGDARGTVILGQVDVQLTPYVIDLQSMHQFRQDTGTMRPVQRNFYDPSSAPGKGIVWEWENDCGSWTPYDMELCVSIQNAYEKQHPWLDLSSLGFSYVVDFDGMSQTNRQSQRKRRIRRRMDLAYPLIAGSIPKSQSWPVGTSSGMPCTCQQCMLVHSTRAASNAGISGEMMETDGDSDEDRRVLALPVKNLTGSGPVHPALAGMTGILMCAAGLPVCLTRAPKPILHPPPISKSDLKPVPGINSIRRKTKKKHLRKGKNSEDVVRRYTEKIKTAPDEDCTICMERLATASGYEGVLSYRGIKPELVGKLGKCGHMYHLLCLVAMYNNGNKDGSLQCPTCKAIYGEKTGTQPPGKMEYHVIPHSLPGCSDSKTIRIVYDIPAGIQTTEHPNPGKKYSARGFPRHCYLPDNEKGRKVLKLLIMAWDRRLIFTIGTSSTTGETDTVVWNEIHHKTEFGSNLTGHGYPDPNYLDNVMRELAAQGVGEDNLKD